MAKYSDLVSAYDHVIEAFDHFLEGYGYKREENHYRVVRENDKTITLFCHFGIKMCIRDSHCAICFSG